MNGIQSDIQVLPIRFGDLTGLHCKPAFPRADVPPLLLVHGMWSTAEIFKGLMEVLALQGYESYALTLRGHGDSRSVADLGKVTTDDYVDDIETVLGCIGTNVVICGWSMGSYLSARTAMRNPGLVDAFIGIASAPVHGIPFMGWRTQALMAKPRYIEPLLRGKAVVMLKEDARRIAYNGIPKDEFEKSFASLVPESGTAARDIAFWRHQVKKLSCPGLIIAGKDDRLTPHQKAVARRLGARYEEMGGCHMILLNGGHELVAYKMDKWLAQVFCE